MRTSTTVMNTHPWRGEPAVLLDPILSHHCSPRLFSINDSSFLHSLQYSSAWPSPRLSPSPTFSNTKHLMSSPAAHLASVKRKTWESSWGPHWLFNYHNQLQNVQKKASLFLFFFFYSNYCFVPFFFFKRESDDVPFKAPSSWALHHSHHGDGESYSVTAFAQRFSLNHSLHMCDVAIFSDANPNPCWVLRSYNLHRCFHLPSSSGGELCQQGLRLIVVFFKLHNFGFF